MAADLTLPGGLAGRDGVLHRDVELRPLTGAVERAFETRSDESYCQPVWVSRVLAATVSRVGDVTMSREVAEQLAVGDRIFLMLHLGILHFRDREWLTPKCALCGEHFDVPVKRSELTVRRPVSPEYPTSSIDLDGKRVVVRGLCGADQRWLVETRPDVPEDALLARCVISIDGAKPATATIGRLRATERAAIESAITESGPDVGCALRVNCPECGAVQEIEFEPYWLGASAADDLDVEVHRIASYYHWNEREILSLPRRQRRRYLALIDQERGRHA